MEDNKNISIAFAAIEKQIETYIPSFVEKENGGKKYIAWGENNQIPEYLFDLFTDVSTLKTIILGTADYVAGDDTVCNASGFDVEVNSKGDTMFEIMKYIARDYLIYGGFALQVIRNKAGKVGEIYYIDFRYLRTSKKQDLFWYSEEYGKKYARSNKTIVYPKFVPEATNIPTSIVYVTNEKSKTYPIPRYSGALKSCEIERHIDEFHLAALDNGFMGSYIINFLNGIPSDEQKAEIEKNVTEKFAGSSNAGRIILNFADSKDNATKVEKLDLVDFGEKYEAAAKRSREQIFCAFQAVPAIFGLPTENKGFSNEEYVEAFKLYSRTVVRPIQRLITKTMDKIFGISNSITIQPFSLEDKKEEAVN